MMVRRMSFTTEPSCLAYSPFGYSLITFWLTSFKDSQ